MSSYGMAVGKCFTQTLSYTNPDFVECMNTLGYDVIALREESKREREEAVEDLEDKLTEIIDTGKDAIDDITEPLTEAADKALLIAVIGIGAIILLAK